MKNKTLAYFQNSIFCAILFSLMTSVSDAATPSSPNRFHSPSGHYDILFEPLADDWTHVRKAQDGLAQEAKEEYALVFSISGSTDSINAVYFSDTGIPPAPQTIVESMRWSAQEAYVVFQDRPHAAIAPHVFQHVASLHAQKIWDLEADHVHWMDDHRLIGDINTKEVPGGIVLFDGTTGTANLLIAPDAGRGYQIAGTSGHLVMIKEILNKLGDDKTTWDHYDPACFTLDMESLKKRSAPCPK